MRITFAGELRLELPIASSINIGKGRAGGDNALRVGDALGGAEDSQELVALTANPAEDA